MNWGKSKSSAISFLIKDESSNKDELVLSILPFPYFIDHNHTDLWANSDNIKQIFSSCHAIHKNGYDTVIGMPFDQGSNYDIAKNEIDNLKSEILLFTNNLAELCIRIEGHQELIWISEEEKKRWHIYKKTDFVPQDIVDEASDIQNSYEIILAVPKDLDNADDSYPLFSFFPTEIIFPFPVICHATLELEANRKHPSSSNLNKFVFERIAEFHSEISEKHAEGINPWLKASLVAKSVFTDYSLQRFGYYEKLIDEVKNKLIIPNLKKEFIKPVDVYTINSEDLAWLPVELFFDVALPPLKNNIKRLFKDLNLTDLTANSLRDRLNNVSFPSIESRAKVIAGLINNDLVPIDPVPELLLDEEGIVIKEGSRTYLPPMGTGKKFELPSWLNVFFLNNELRALLMQHLAITEQRELRVKLSPFNVNEYALGNIAAAIAVEAKKRIDRGKDNADDIVQHTIIALLLMFPEDETPPKLAETTGVLLPNMKGSLTLAKNLYFSRGYMANGELLSALYEHCCLDNLLASPDVLGLDGNDQSHIDFLKWLGVADLPRTKIINTVKSGYLDYVLDSLPYPIKLEGYERDSQDDFPSPSIREVVTIDMLEEILQADPGAILTWLITDDRAARWKFPSSLNADLRDKNKHDKNHRHYSGSIPSYIHWIIQNTAWLPAAGNRKEKPSRCLLGEKGLEKIFPPPAHFSSPLFKKYEIDKYKLHAGWDNSGVMQDISYLSRQQIARVLLELPKIDPDGKTARGLYRTILVRIDPNRDQWHEPPEEFYENGKMWGKGPEGYGYYPVKVLRHADTDDIPEAISNQISLVDLPKRVGANQVQKIFGIEPIDRRKFTQIIESYKESHRNKDIQLLFQKAKLYIYALRQVKTKKASEINAFKKLKLIICKTINITLDYQGVSMKASLEPYKWIIIEDEAYILEDPVEEPSFNSDLFVDTVGAILAFVFRIENGGDFARILRCNPADRTRLLKKILGDSEIPGFDKLRKEFEEDTSILDFEYKPQQPSTPQKKVPPGKEPESPAKTSEAEHDVSSTDLSPGELEVNPETHIPIAKKTKKTIIQGVEKLKKASGYSVKRVVDGDLCENKTIEFEKHEGRWPLKVSNVLGYQGPRCDILSFKSEEDKKAFIESAAKQKTKADLIDRFIEVKGRSSERSAIQLKGNELDAAEVNAERYYIYRLYQRNPYDYTLHILKNPLLHTEAVELIKEIDLLRAKKTERFNILFGPEPEGTES